MEYRILWQDSPQELEQAVFTLIKDGWLPLGGVSAAVYFDSEKGYEIAHWQFSQAMTKVSEAER